MMTSVPQSAIDHLRRGLALAQRKRYQDALKEIDRAIEIDQKFAKAYYYRGNLNVVLDKPENAIQDLTQSLAIDQNQPKALYQLGILLERKNQLTQALGYFEQAAELGHEQATELINSVRERLKNRFDTGHGETVLQQAATKSAEEYMESGLSHLMRHRYESALADFDQVIGLEPLNWEAYEKRGSIHFAMESYEKALADYNQAISIKAGVTDLYLKRAQIHYALRQYEQAASDYDNYFQYVDEKADQNERIEAYIGRGKANLELKENRKALKDFNAALEIDPTHSGAYSARGQVFLNRGQLRRAVRDFSEAIEHFPGNAEAFYYRGALHVLLERLNEALYDFNRAIELEPHNSDIYVDRGVLYGRMGEPGRELVDYEHAIQLNPNNATAHFHHGNYFYQNRKYERAIVSLTHAIELQPDNHEAYTVRGICYWKLNQLGDGLKDFHKALALNPGDEMMRANLHSLLHNWKPETTVMTYLRGLQFVEIEAYESAILDFTAVIEKDPNYLDGYKDRGKAYMKLGRYIEAVRDFNKVLEVKPDDYLIRMQRGNCLLLQDQYNAAIRDLKKAKETNPEDPMVHQAIGDAYVRLGKPRDAIEAYTEAIRLEGDEIAKAFNNRGEMWVTLGEHGKALPDFEASIVNDPTLAVAHYNAGDAYQRLGRYWEASVAFQKAIELEYEPAEVAYLQVRKELVTAEKMNKANELVKNHPHEANSYVERAKILGKTGRYEAALADIKYALELDPNFVGAYVTRGSIYEEHGEESKALESFERALKLDPNSVEALLGRGKLYLNKWDTSRAQHDYNEAIRIDHENPLVYFEMGNFLFSTGDLGRALPMYLTAIELEPEFHEAFYKAGYVYAELGELNKALEFYEMAAELGNHDAMQFANSLREKLEAPLGSLGDEPLRPQTTESEHIQLIANTLEHFAFLHCGSRVETRVRIKTGLLGRSKKVKVQVVKWRVHTEKLSSFDRTGAYTEWPSVFLELPQIPQSVMRVSHVNEQTYLVELMTEAEDTGSLNEPFTTVLSESIPADQLVLLKTLNEIVKKEYLVVANGRLRYSGKRQNGIAQGLSG